MAHYYQAAVLCRLCREMTTTNNTVALFSKSSYKQNLPSRINSLLDVNVTDNDDLPKHVHLSQVQKEAGVAGKICFRPQEFQGFS